MKTIFFDWGGVVADDPGDDFLKKLLVDLGASEGQIKDIFQNYMSQFMAGQISESEYWDALRDNYGFNIKDSISDEFKKWNGLVANEQVLELVKKAKLNGWKTAILSNVIEPTYNVLNYAGLYRDFDVIIASCKVGYAKPDKRIYDIALDMAGASANESIFIDDKQRNLDPAIEMGFKTILAKNPDQTITDISNAIS